MRHVPLAVLFLHAIGTLSCGEILGLTDPAVGDLGGGPDAGVDTSAPLDAPANDGPGTDSAAPITPYALMLDGLNDHVLLPPGDVYSSSAGFTWEIWFAPSAPPPSTDTAIGRAQTIIAIGDPADCEDSYLGFGSELTAHNHLTLVVDGAGGCAQRDDIPVFHAPTAGWEKGRWYHVAAVQDAATQSVRLYLDGKVVGQKIWTRAPIVRSRAPQVGRWATMPGDEAAYFKGLLDEIRFYARPLTAGEVSAHYAAGLGSYGVPETGLVAGYHLDEGKGEVLFDYASLVNRRDGQIVNGAGFAPGWVKP